VNIFFQGEDGRRDYLVTGVQTCALPISKAGPSLRARSARFAPACHPERSARNARVAKDLLLCIEQQILRACGAQDDRLARSLERSEERRVGKVVSFRCAG